MQRSGSDEVVYTTSRSVRIIAHGLESSLSALRRMQNSSRPGWTSFDFGVA